MFTEEKPASPEEILETLQHYGVPGMRWGHRKENSSTGFGGRRRVSIREANKIERTARREKTNRLGRVSGHRTITDSGGQTTRLNPSVTSYRLGNIRSTHRARRLTGGVYGFNAPNMMRMSAVHQAALPGIRKDLAKINRSPNTVKGNASPTRSYFQGALQRNHPARVKYDSQVESIVRKNYQNTITKTYGKKYSDLDFKVVRVDNKIVNGSRFAVKVTPKVRHDSLNEDPTTLEFEVKYIRDKNGFVTGIELVENPKEIAQSASEIIEDILIHRGTVKV